MLRATQDNGLLSGRLSLIAIATTILFMIVLLYLTILRPSFLAPERRQLLMRFADQLEIGQSREVVRTTYQTALASYGIELDESDPDYWTFATPTEFGATNWILIVSFYDEDVDGIGVRTADSLKAKPREGPADRVTTGAEERWETRFGPTWGT